MLRNLVRRRRERMACPDLFTLIAAEPIAATGIDLGLARSAAQRLFSRSLTVARPPRTPSSPTRTPKPAPTPSGPHGPSVLHQNLRHDCILPDQKRCGTETQTLQTHVWASLVTTGYGQLNPEITADLCKSGGTNLAIDNQATNLAIIALRAQAERANALLKSGWKALCRITLCPWRIGNIVAAALVLTTMQRPLVRKPQRACKTMMVTENPRLRGLQASSRLRLRVIQWTHSTSRRWRRRGSRNPVPPWSFRLSAEM